MNIFKQLFGGSTSPDLQTIISVGAFLVDVRTREEFAGGHIKGSVNIPVAEIVNQLSKFEHKSNIVVFCQSGGRSWQAKSILKQNGFNNVVNGGTWTSVKKYVK